MNSKATTFPPRKDLLNITSLSLEEINDILDQAGPFKKLFKRSVKKVPTLRGKSVLNLFYEPSTRTRSSFEIAAKRLSADVTNFTVAQSSVVKGESIIDTIDTLQSMHVDYIIVRHKQAGVPEMIANHTGASVVNAGDGFHAHPSQALLDAYTLREILGDVKGKRILIVGDIIHSRVARSTSVVCNRLGMEVAFLGPRTLVPKNGPSFTRTFDRYEEAMDWKPEVIYLLRLQLERMQANFFPTMREYHQVFGINKERFKTVQDRGIHIMHPGPVNRGVELTDEVMSYERCWVNRQVENGIAARMAILYRLQPQVKPREVDEEVKS